MNSLETRGGGRREGGVRGGFLGDRSRKDENLVEESLSRQTIGVFLGKVSLTWLGENSSSSSKDIFLLERAIHVAKKMQRISEKGAAAEGD